MGYLEKAEHETGAHQHCECSVSFELEVSEGLTAEEEHIDTVI